MASSLSLWEVDPFFPAAEEVQNSTDRMESIFRAWKYTQGVAQATPENACLAAAVNTNKRDLVTALDTVRWQLDEFARAVKVATTTDQLYLGEDAKSRHSQFVRAIQSQVANVEKELGDSFGKKQVKFEEADSQCLALFLSGSDVVDEFSMSPRAAASISEDLEDAGSAATIDVCSDSEAPSVSFKIDVERCNGHSTVNGYGHRNGECSQANGHSIHQVNGYSKDSYIARFWALWKGRNHQQQQGSKFQMSNSGLKRWKDGDAGLLERAGDCISALRNGCMGDLEQGGGTCRSNGRKQLNGSYSPPKLEVFVGDRGSSSSSSCTIQRRFQRAHQLAIPFGNAVQITAGAIVVVGLMGLYFWFLSTLVPYDHQAVPGNFLN